ncbi:MAG TPA: hypothetical protein VGR37_21995 [Longimicrobiaceae bacterium]|nr:hypothetical protein [Longimicrobiaceae bacterium]
MNRRIGFVVGLLVAGAVAGVLLFGLVRLAFLPPQPVTHYHANWALFVEGERLDLADERYMEDVVRCKANPAKVDPEDRVHLHNLDPDVVHVHDGGATWGHLLLNLGITVGDDHLFTDTGARYVAAPGRTLKFILNGEEVPSIRNLVIDDQDRLLISFGPETAEEAARTQFPRVASTAGEHNTRPDPAGCSGAAEEGFGDRLARAFWF